MTINRINEKRVRTVRKVMNYAGSADILSGLEPRYLRCSRNVVKLSQVTATCLCVGCVLKNEPARDISQYVELQNNSFLDTHVSSFATELFSS
jgi:hypothetical protein